MSYYKFIPALILFFSCTGNSSDQSTILKDSTLESVAKARDYNNDVKEDNKLIWSTDFDSVTGDFVLTQHKKINPDSLTGDKLIQQINAAWNKVKLEFIKISNDTLYVAIPNSFHLTQGMGSSGAANYLASTTFNLTELKGIKFVNYDFEEGDHLSPGTMSRNDFKNFR